MTKRTLTIILDPDLEGQGYTVTVPYLPELTTQGETIEECIAMARDAIAVYLEDLDASGEPVPEETLHPAAIPLDEEISVTSSSGNVFADLSLPDPPERLLKADLLIRLARLMKERRLTDAEAAVLLGVDEPTVDRLLRGGPGEFSLEQLLRFLIRFDQDIEIRVRPSAGDSVRVRVA